MPSSSRILFPNRMDAGNFARIVPVSPPTFQVDASHLTERPCIPGKGPKTIVQLQKERMIQTEKDLGIAFSKAAKDFIGTKANGIWENNDAFGIGQKIERSKGKETGKLKSILKRSQSQNNEIRRPHPGMSRTFEFEKKRNPISAGNVNENRRVTFDPIEQVIPQPRPAVEKTEHRILNFKIANPPSSKATTDLQNTISSEEIKVVRGYAFLASDGDKGHQNTFAHPKPLEGMSVLGGGFRKKVDMGGFLDSEIHFETDDSSVLVVTGLRPSRDGLDPKKVVDVVKLPEETYHETLLILRDAEGILTIQTNKN